MFRNIKFSKLVLLICASLFTCSLQAQTTWNQSSTSADVYLSNSNAQIGIGTTNPQARIHGLGSLVMEGNTGATPLSGAGTRLMWAAGKSAFRVGTVNSSQWDDIKIGIGSVALGENTIASGSNAFAFGKNSISGGDNAFAIGQNAEATGQNAFAYGYGVQATANNSFALGIGKLDGNGLLSQGAINADANSFKLFLGDVNPVFKIEKGTWGTSTLPGEGGDDPQYLIVPCSQGWTMYGDNGTSLRIGAKTSGDIFGNQTKCGGNLCADVYLAGEKVQARRWLEFGGVDCDDNLPDNGFVLWRKDDNQLVFGQMDAGGLAPDRNRDYMRLLSNSTFEIGKTLNRSDYALTISGKPNPNNLPNDLRDRRAILANGNITIDRNLLSGENYSPCFQTTLAGDENAIKTTAAFRVGSTINGNNVGATIFGDGKAIFSGNVGIGMDNPTQALCVKGTICSQESRVSLTGSACWPDYVFESNYQLMPLAQVDAYLKTNKHLPGIPSAKEVEQEGIELGKMNALLLQKIEEMTLHMIEMQKQIEELKAKTSK